MAFYNVPLEFEQRLERSLQDAILILGLIDTGALYDSIQVGIEVNMPNASTVDIAILVFSEDYAKYLVEPFDILSTWQSQTLFEDVIADLIYDYTTWRLETQGLESYESLDYSYNLLLNNNEWFYEG